MTSECAGTYDVALKVERPVAWTAAKEQAAANVHSYVRADVTVAARAAPNANAIAAIRRQTRADARKTRPRVRCLTNTRPRTRSAV